MKIEPSSKMTAEEEPKVSVPPAAPAALPVRNGWLVLLSALAALYALHWATPVIIPVLLGAMISYALTPVVNAMERWHIHRALGSAVVVIGIVAGSGWLVYSLADETAAVIETLPDAAQKFRQALRAERAAGPSAIEKVQKAASEIEKAANETAMPDSAAPRGVTRVQIEKPKLNVQAWLWSGTMGALTFFGQLVTVLFFAYFLLAAGDKFRRKLMSISGARLSEKKVTIEMLDEISGQIQRYLLVQLSTSVLVGVASWLAFSAIGLENAAVWGIAAGVLNSVPYFGPIIVSSAIALAITGVEGYVLTPWLIGRTARINAVVVFACVIVGGWLWGPWGLLLAVPVVMMIKAVCDRVEHFKPVGELLGD